MPQIITLGTTLLDEFCWESDAAVGDVEPSFSSSGRPNEVRIGGGGVYAALGARIWLPPSQVGCIVHRGPDFPEEIKRQLDVYGEKMWHFLGAETPTPRALNTYRPPSPTRHFHLLTPPPPLLPSSFPSPSPAGSPDPQWIHACCTPTHLSDILTSLKHEKEGEKGVRVVYEPLPPSCLPSSLPTLLPLLPHLFLLSPNHLEAASLLGLPSTAVGSKEGVEEVAGQLRELGARRVVVRCGGWGSYWVDEQGKGGWCDAWHDEERQGKVRDTVGAGNAFLGGLLASLSLSPNPSSSAEPSLGEHAERASISASFVVEQMGFPLLSFSKGGDERWNGDTPGARLEDLRSRRGRSAIGSSSAGER